MAAQQSDTIDKSAQELKSTKDKLATGASKILEKTNFDEVFDANDIDSQNYSDYNSIKDAVHSKLRQ